MPACDKASIAARRHNINANVVFRWRREYREGYFTDRVAPSDSGLPESGFMPVGIVDSHGSLRALPPPPKPTQADRTVGLIDIRLQSGIVVRIGADVAPWWDAPAGTGEQQPGYETSTPSTRNAFVNTCTRSFMHRRLWSNDPDCVMLRKGTQLPASIAKAWAETVGCSGGLVLVSDDLTRLGPDARRLLDDVVSLGRSADAAALAGRTPRCDALLDPAGPTGLRGPAGDVRVDPVTGAGGLV